nr:MAG TPA: hypothetical protein [Bacteriophage sp.]
MVKMVKTVIVLNLFILGMQMDLNLLLLLV